MRAFLWLYLKSYPLRRTILAKDESKRLTPSILQADRESIGGLKTITNYTLTNAAFSVASIDTLAGEVAAAQETEAKAAASLSAARDSAVAKEWELHNRVIGMKDQVVAIYGRDSNEAQAVGRKKSSERRSSRKTAAK
jgi:hypothetical protein